MSEFLSATVMLGVPDPGRSTAWWQMAGFELVQTDGEWQEDGRVRWAYLKRGDASLMLTTGVTGAALTAPVQLFFRVGDADAVWGELRNTFGPGLDVDEPPSDRHYGMRDFWIRDGDGFQIGFGHMIDAEPSPKKRSGSHLKPV